MYVGTVIDIGSQVYTQGSIENSSNSSNATITEKSDKLTSESKKSH